MSLESYLPFPNDYQPFLEYRGCVVAGVLALSPKPQASKFLNIRVIADEELDRVRSSVVE